MMMTQMPIRAGEDDRAGSPDIQHVVLIDRAGLSRDCLSYRLACEGLAVSCLDTVESPFAAEGSPPCLVILFNEGTVEEVGQDLTVLFKSFEKVPVVVLSSSGELARVVSLLAAGARGYIPYHSTMSDLLGAIRLVMSGGTYIPASVLLSARHAPEPKSEPWKGSFTPKQAAIIEGLRRGKPNKIIAYELSMCESTVKVHIRNVMQKLNVRNRTELAYRIAEGTYGSENNSP